MVLGALDKLLGNKFGLGKEFENGFMALGSLALAMIGIISFAPVLAGLLKPLLVPVYSFFGADPAMFATTFLANDMGGYHLAMDLAQTTNAGLFAGLLLGSMLGATIVFTIPVALGIIRKQDHDYLAKGILIGLTTIPLGCFVGGLFAGFSIKMMFFNLIPIMIISLLIILGLWKFPEFMIRGFKYFGKGVIAVTTLSVVIIVIETLTGFVIIPGMAPISEGFQIIGSIAIILIGAFPMVYVITKYLKKPLSKLGSYVGINDSSVAGLIASLANNIPMFVLFKKMDNKGKILNVAFAVGAAFVFGDHLGFTAGINQSMIFPVIVGKLTAGITAFAIAAFMLRENKESNSNGLES